MMKLLKLCTSICAAGLLLSNCSAYKPLEKEQSAQLKKVAISSYKITDDNRLYQSNGLSLRDNSNTKIGRENTLPKTVVSTIYDSTDAQLGHFTGAEIIPKLEKRNKKYFNEYDLPDHSRSSALKKQSCDAVVEINARLKGGGTLSGSGFRRKTPKVKIKARMFDKNNQLIWRNKVRLKGSKLNSGQLQFGGLALSISEGLTMEEVQELFDATFRELFKSKKK